MFAQDGYGRGEIQTDYKAFENCVKNLKEKAEEHNLTVAMPYNIGCGLAGGDWNVIFSILEKYFKYSPINLYIVKQRI